MNMIVFWQEVLTALQMVGITITLLLIAYAANMAMSLYVNIAVVKQKFEVKRLILGFAKVIILSIGLALTTVLLVAIPTFMNYVGIEIPEEFLAAYNITAVVAVFCRAIVKYTVEAVGEAGKIINDFHPFSESETASAETAIDYGYYDDYDADTDDDFNSLDNN